MSARVDRVIITGASSGIGFDLARRFLAAGSHLVINSRDPEKLERARRELDGGSRVVAVPGPVGEAATARAVAAAARERLGGADVLVNNAGVFAPKPFLETTEDDLLHFFTTNVKGAYLMTQAIVPLMIEGGGGAIINVGAALVQQAMAGVPASAAMVSKGAVHALTISLASELAKYNIRVNTLAPGTVRTPLVGDADAQAALHPLRRIGEVADTSDAVLYLARAGFVSGTTLEVDGGYSHGR